MTNVTEEMMEKPKEPTLLGIEITPAKVVATYLALQPILADAFGVWDKLRPFHQDVLLCGSVLGAIIYMVLYGLYVRDRKVAQLHAESKVEQTKMQVQQNAGVLSQTPPPEHK